MTHWSDALVRLGACVDAEVWASTQPTYEGAWAACPRGDWLLWLAARVCPGLGTPKHRALVLAACDCAETALVHMPEGERRPQLCIERARAWALDEATTGEVLHARSAVFECVDDNDEGMRRFADGEKESRHPDAPRAALAYAAESAAFAASLAWDLATDNATNAILSAAEAATCAARFRTRHEALPDDGFGAFAASMGQSAVLVRARVTLPVLEKEK